MSMWEIDTLLISSIELIKESNLEKKNKKHIIWNLEQIPETYEFDAGRFLKSELDTTFEYEQKHPYQLGSIITKIAENTNNKELIYHWSAFLLNFWDTYFKDIENLEKIKAKHLTDIKNIFSKFNFNNFNPIHATLTISNCENEWFSREQNDLIKWFLTKE